MLGGIGVLDVDMHRERVRVRFARKAFEQAWGGADVTLGPDLLGAPR